MIALIDYGAGNLTSVRKALAAVGAPLFAPAAPGELAMASGIIVPGVGHFAWAAVLAGNWHHAIAARVAAGRPLLGICLGMQWLFDGSDEAPGVPGFGAVRATVRRMASDGVKVPHVGWNTLEVTADARILRGLPSGTHVYFTHSYAAPVTPETVAVTTHGIPFAAAVEAANVYGVQFHPEKSGDAGLRVLRNFTELAC